MKPAADLENGVKRQHVERCCDRCRCRQAHNAITRHDIEIQRDVDRQCTGRNEHRSASIFTAEKCRLEHFHKHIGGQAANQRNYDIAHDRGVFGCHASTLEYTGGECFCADRKCHGTGQAKQHGYLDRIALQALRFAVVVRLDMARQHGQDRGAQCNPEDAERHLVQAVGQLQQRERSLRQTGGKEGVDQLADLVNSGSEGCR